MNIGDKVVRNPQYTWCLCRFHYSCWCKKPGEWTIVDAEPFPSQSGVMVVAERGGKQLEAIDAAHFVPVSQGKLKGF